jgi:hypothetical protein
MIGSAEAVATHAYMGSQEKYENEVTCRVRGRSFLSHPSAVPRWVEESLLQYCSEHHPTFSDGRRKRALPADGRHRTAIVGRVVGNEW